MSVPIGFFRSKNFTTNLRGALKIDAIFATDNAVGTEAFQGWLADSNVVKSFNDALIENNIGVVDTESFNISLSNRFAYTAMSGGRRVAVSRILVVEFQQDINPLLGTFNKGDIIEFFSNGTLFGSVTPPSNGDGYKIFGIGREKSISIQNIVYSNGVATVTVDPNENLTGYSVKSSTGNNYQEDDTIVIQNVTPANYNGAYKISNVTPNTFEIAMASVPPAYIGGGTVYKSSNKLLLTSVLRGRVVNVTFANNSNTISLVTSTIQGQISQNQIITGPGIVSGTRVGSYNSTTKVITLTQSTIGGATNATLEFEKNSASNIIIPSGSTVSAGSPAPFLPANVGSVINSYQVSTPKSYYINGDDRLNYFWSAFHSSGEYFGFDQNFISDGSTNASVSGIPTEQLIGSEIVFETEDTFNNIIKTFSTSRGEAENDDYNPQGKSALLYISATDSQGNTGTSGRGGPNKLGSSTSAYTVNSVINTINEKNGYWVGIIGGSFLNNCQNEIQTFRKDTSDGIFGDPRGFTPIRGEITSLRVGVPIQTITYDGVLATCTTYYDHKFGNNNSTLQIRIKNSTSSDLNGLKQITIISPKQFTFEQPNLSITSLVNFDDYGYALNITDLLTVPKGFYRKSILKYIDSSNELNDSRILSAPPGLGLDRKDILVTVNVIETGGSLQFFSDYPFGDFFVGLPNLNEFPFFAYPVDGRDIKFKVSVSKQFGSEIIDTILLNPGISTVVPKEEFSIYIYATEFTATVIAQDVNNTWIDINNLELGSNVFGRPIAELSSSGSGYLNENSESSFSAENITTEADVGSGSGLILDVTVLNGEIINFTINQLGTGYAPGDTGTIDAPIDGSFTTAATYTIRSIESNLFVELSLNQDGSQDYGISNKTQITSVTDNLDGSYRIFLDASLVDNVVAKDVSFIFPIEQKIVNIYVKPSNNFKDITVTQEAIAENLVNENSDIFITFAGYGYDYKDVLTPIDVTNIPAFVDPSNPPIWISDTKISLDGFIYSGLSVSGEQSYILTNISGDKNGVGASFRVTESISQVYVVELLDQGSDFQVTEKIIIPGYDIGGSSKPSFIQVISDGDGYTPGVYTSIQTTSSGIGTGLTLSFEINSNGSLNLNTLEFDATSAINYALNDQIFVDTVANPSLGLFTTELEFVISSTENDLTITINEIVDDSRVVLTTLNSHNFIPPLGRTTVDILVEGIISNGSASSFNGKFSALVVNGTTLEYNLAANPGIYASGGTITNVSIDVVNDTFASFSEKLFFNVNQITNDPSYPKISFISSAQYDNGNILITTLEPHNLTNGEEIRISGIVTTRNSDWNIGKTTITVPATTPTTIGNFTITDNQRQFVYSKIIGGNAGTHISGTGEITNPYVKVIGGVYTKDFNRIVFANTSAEDIDILDTNNQVVDVLPSLTTKDFVVRDINFRQITNDGNLVEDGPKHNFYVLNSDTLAIPARSLTVDSIVYNSEFLEYIVTTSTPHGLYENNYFSIDINNSNYDSPTGGNAAFDTVVRVISDTQFSYKIFVPGRDPITLASITGGNLGTVIKPIENNIIFSGLNNGSPLDLCQFSGLQGMPGLTETDSYYVVNYNEVSAQGNVNYITFKLSKTKTGSGITFNSNINNVIYNKTAETASIEVLSSTPHNLSSGNIINISGVSSTQYNGQKTVEDIISPTIFTIDLLPVRADADIVNDTQPKTVLTSTSTTAQSSVEIRRISGTVGTNIVTIRATGTDSAAYNIVVGMVVTGTVGDAISAIAPNTIVTGWNSATKQITLSTNLIANIVTNTSRITLNANVVNSRAIAFNPQTGFNPGLSQLQVGQLISGIGIIPNTYIVDLYKTSDDPDGVGVATNNAAYKTVITISNPLTTQIPNNSSLTVQDNLIGTKSIRVQNITNGTIPFIGSEVIHFNSSNQETNAIEDGTKIVSLVSYSINGSTGYIIELDNSLLQTIPQAVGSQGYFKFYPASNLGLGGTVSPITTTVTNNIIDNQNTTFRGQVYLSSDIVGWDHVKLAKETGGALFFQLGFAKRFTGNINSNTITVIAADSIVDIPTGTAAAGWGVYGDGIAPGATIVSISGDTITLSDPNIAPVGGGTNGPGTYIGFSRPESVSIFPKYTQEFGRILGKTFAEWLFKIA